MKWLTRSSTMAAASALLVVGAAALILRSAPAQPRPVAVAVGDGDREIVWLFTTTNATSWERFVAAVRRAAPRLQDQHPGLQLQIGEAAFPKQTTAVPEVALTWPDQHRRLVFRWYKLTSDWKTRDWVEALLKRRPPPLAIIGGSSSDAARELAWQLQRQSADMAPTERPLLLLTTATADRVSLPESPQENGSVDLTRVYPDRTFRYCFTNKQMADAVMGFLWNQDSLRPDANPVHMVQWDDDAYSRDLTDGFREALPPLAGIPNPKRIASSVGSFLSPNRFEADVVGQVLQDLDGKRPPQAHPLLVVTGQSAPSRRFLHELARTSPAQAHRLVVATGDAVSFNFVYRDRRVTWPIQDLPFPFVFFCHFNPIDADAGFRAEDEGEGDQDSSATGTEDILLNSAIVETLVQALERDGRTAANAAELSARLAKVRHKHGRFGYDAEGVLLFGPDGNRRGGAGENIVYLRPTFEGDRVLPKATIEVWYSRESIEAEHPWKRRDENNESLKISYEPPVVEERSAP
ncbi:MAG TPA: hypothetical protein DDY78_06360 [Planctomycetales bacterium]|nr:hypothetical protein [Planctomycetales bacterium]